jgi:hypothetical protein
MTPADQRVLFTALGFLAVILSDVPEEKQALRATAIARLIESFCMSAAPEAFGDKCVEDDASLRDRVVSVIAAIIEADGTCNSHELENHGFNQEEITSHWPIAYALARVTINNEPNKDS